MNMIIINIFLYLPYPLSILFKNKLNNNLIIIINGILLQLSIYYLILTLGIIYYLILNINIINNNINIDSSNSELIDEYPNDINNLNIIIILLLLIIIIYLQIKLSKNQYDLLK
jgi:uncharacterized membrane protein